MTCACRLQMVSRALPLGVLRLHSDNTMKQLSSRIQAAASCTAWGRPLRRSSPRCSSRGRSSSRSQRRACHSSCRSPRLQMALVRQRRPRLPCSRSMKWREVGSRMALAQGLHQHRYISLLSRIPSQKVELHVPARSCAFQVAIIGVLCIASLFQCCDCSQGSQHGCRWREARLVCTNEGAGGGSCR